jgi:pilus assembly protein Flp/PilA
MIRFITSGLSRFIRDEEGASGIEYALIAAMVAIVLVNFVTPIRGAIDAMFTEIQGALQEAAGTGAGD